MDLRAFLRPLPVILVSLFVAVAVGDLVQTLIEDPPPPPEPVGSIAPRFETLEPVIDFRAGREATIIELQPVVRLEPDQWYGAERQGVWAASETAEITFDLGAGGHRLLFLECLPVRGRYPVETVNPVINGNDCGVISLAPEWGQYRIELADGVVRSGANRISFRFERRDRAPEPRRMLLIRKLGFFLSADAKGEVENHARPVLLGPEAEKIRIRATGTLEIPLTLDDRTDSLRFRYRFMSGAGRAEAAVIETAGGTAGVDAALKASVSADRKDRGWVRIPLHGRRGAYVLRIRATVDSSHAPLVISSLRLVEEGDPSRRPWAANPLHRQSTEDRPREE